MEKDFSTIKNNKLYMYILYFFIFAILGWCMETIYSFIVLGREFDSFKIKKLLKALRMLNFFVKFSLFY